MSVASAQSAPNSSEKKRSGSEPGQRWMISSGVDSFLILLTPLLAAPAVLLLSSSVFGIQATTISLIVASFFALGHHLPGMIRAYGDRELFERFRWRFILAPPLVFLAYFPLYTYHHDVLRLIIRGWATWHGLMQVYGFVRIYDSKVGSTSRATANWDWMVCVCGFVTPQLFRPDLVSNTLRQWYTAGGPFIPPSVLNAVRWGWLAVSVVVLIGFTINYVTQLRRGPRPNPLKLLMLASGIGTWSFAMCFVEELILGIALFDICHDVQYNAIVWMYNRRLVGSNPQLGGFMKYLFRRGMVLLYLGLITAYGAIGLVPALVADGTVSSVFYGVIFTSTILHYYYDGFIWKVRESVNQANLGLSENSMSLRGRLRAGGRYAHGLKWSPAIVILGLLLATDLMDPPLKTAEKEAIEDTYIDTLIGNPVLPQRKAEVSWLYTRFKAAQDVAAAVPEDRGSQLIAAVMLANFGRNDEALERLEQLSRQYPDYRDSHIAVGDIQSYLGNLDQASASYLSALSLSKTREERALMNLTLGELELQRKDFVAARIKFQEALNDDPQLSAVVDALEKGTGRPLARRSEQDAGYP